MRMESLTSTINRKVFILNPKIGVLLNWLNVPNAKSFYVYKSVNILNKFSNISLLANVPNPFFWRGTSVHD